MYIPKIYFAIFLHETYPLWSLFLTLQVTLFMELENLRYGKLKGYEGIFTTNANRLTQHISRILGYQILSTIQVNQWEDTNGSRPFAEAPDDLVTEVALKWFD